MRLHLQILCKLKRNKGKLIPATATTGVLSKERKNTIKKIILTEKLGIAVA